MAHKDRDLSPDTYFLITCPVVLFIACMAVIYPDHTANAFTTAAHYIYTLFDWMVLWLPLAILATCLSIAFSKTGKKRLGGKDAKPEYSTFSWLSMLFTAGIGVGIIFYGPLEGLWHFLYSNYSQLPYITASEKASMAMSTSFWLWGVPAWSIYTISAVVIAYFFYFKDGRLNTGSPIRIAFKKHRWCESVARLTMALTIITVSVSLAASLAMAAGQINGGMQSLLADPTLNIAPWILLGLFILYSICSLTPINQGMKKLSDITILTSIVLLLFIFITGPTRYFLMTLVESIGHTVKGTLVQSFNLFIFDESRYWINWFAMSYFIWWVGWTPFMGVFIAKISEGRTLKEMILSSIFVPAGFIFIWFSVFSGFALLDTVKGSGAVAKAAEANYQQTIYALLDLFPFSGITKILLAILFIAFVVTTIVSGCITLGILTSKDGVNPAKPKIFIWGVFMSAIALPFVLSGKIEGIKAVGSIIGFPYMFCFFMTLAALFKALRHDNRQEEKRQNQSTEKPSLEALL
jgi:choline-glycine betaine transporter